MRIIINGTGIAGPTLAYWLRQAGHEVLLVEAAAQLRTGGDVIDFGLVGYDIAEKMGLIPRLQELGYQVKVLRYVAIGVSVVTGARKKKQTRFLERFFDGL